MISASSGRTICASCGSFKIYKTNYEKACLGGWLALAARAGKLARVAPAVRKPFDGTSMAKPDSTPQANPNTDTAVVSGQALAASDAASLPPDSRRTCLKLPTSVLIAAGVLLAAAALIPVYQYYKMVLDHAVNVPFGDDFDAGLRFLVEYTFNANTLSEKIRLLYAQHNEHRIVLNRIACLTDYALFGNLNFRRIILFANFSLLLVLWLLFQMCFPEVGLSRRIYYFLPVPFLLFQAHYWELSVWATAAVQNLYVLAFALLSFWAISRSAERWILFPVACTAAVAAAFTSGNGLFVFLAGIPALQSTKQYRRLGIWVAVGAAIAGLYFWGYERPSHHPAVLQTFLTTPTLFFDYLFTLTGSDFSARPERAALAGKLMAVSFLGLLAWNAYTKQLERRLAVLTLLVFLYLTCLSLAAARMGLGVVQALSPRYGILPAMLLMCLYALAVETVSQRWAKAAVAGLGLLLSVYLNWSSHEHSVRRIEGWTTTLSYTAAIFNDNPENLLSMPRIVVEHQRLILFDAVEKGVYRVPPIQLADLKSPAQPFDATALAPTNDALYVEPHTIHDYLVFLQSWVSTKGLPPDRTQIRIVAQGRGNSYSFETRQHIGSNMADPHQSPQSLLVSISCIISKGDLKPGRYKLWLELTGPDARFYVSLELFPRDGVRRPLTFEV
jgi:hypothetical protein